MTDSMRIAIIVATYLAIPLAGISVDIYTPSLPFIAHDFFVTSGLAQDTVMSYVLGFALGQIFSGPVTDAKGRRRPIIVGLSFYVLATIFILGVHHISWLILWRLVQGLSVALLSVSVRAILSDLFEGTAYRQAAQWLTVIWAIGPIVAPWIGAQLQAHFGWRASFVGLLSYASVLLVFFICVYPDTSGEKRPLRVRHFIEDYRLLLSAPVFVWGTVLLGILYAVLLMFTLVAPFVVEGSLHLPVIVYGNVALMLGCAWFLGNSINHFLSSRTARKSLWIFSVVLIFSLVFVVLTAVRPASLALLSMPTLVIVFFCAILFSVFVGATLSRFPQVPGTANGLLFSGVWVVCSVIGWVVTHCRLHTEFSLAVLYLVLLLCCASIYFKKLHRVTA